MVKNYRIKNRIKFGKDLVGEIPVGYGWQHRRPRTLDFPLEALGLDEETERTIKNKIKENKLVVDIEKQRQGYPIDKQYVEERLKE